MKPFTTGRLRWNLGVSFGVVSKAMVDFFAKTDLQFDRHHGRPDHSYPAFKIWRGEQRYEFLDRPWEDDPMLKPQFWSARWALLEPNGARWASFSYNWQEQPGATLDKLPDKVFELGFGFEGLLYFYSGYTAAGSFEQALKKYYLFRGLFHALNCDELIGAKGGTLTKGFDPLGGWCFRFVKAGVQVLIRALEEKRMPSHDAAPEFLFVEAPALT